MEFKSYSISHLINSLSEGSKYFEIIYFLKLHITYILLLFLVIFSNIYSHKNNFRKNLLNFLIQNKFIIVQLFSIFGIFLLYNFMSVRQHGDFRYSMVISFFFIYLILYFFEKYELKIKKNFLKYIMILLLGLGINKSFYFLPISNVYEGQIKLIESYKFSALEMKEIVPKNENVKIASVEMASYPLFLERDVEDLFGYSNNIISKARKCNFYNIKINPNYISNYKPDLIFERSLPNDYFDIINKKNKKELIERVIDLKKYTTEDYFSHK